MSKLLYGSARSARSADTCELCRRGVAGDGRITERQTGVFFILTRRPFTSFVRGKMVFQR